MQHHPRFTPGVDGVGDVQIVREALREVLPRMHRGVLRDEITVPVIGRTELVVAVDGLGVAGAFVAEQLATLGEVPVRAGPLSMSTFW